MVADYYYRKFGRELNVSEWLKILDVTMNNDIWRESGTKKENMVLALNAIGFKTTEIDGNGSEEKLLSLEKSTSYGNPVIVKCLIRPKRISYRHFAVVTGVDEKYIIVQDPYPWPNYQKDNSYKVKRNIFIKSSPESGELVWGPKKWGAIIKYKGK
jgi:hypothetical protein